jgi:hypothetical protein
MFFSHLIKLASIGPLARAEDHACGDSVQVMSLLSEIDPHPGDWAGSGASELDLPAYRR